MDNKNKTVDMSVAEMQAELEISRRTSTEMKATIDSLTKQLSAAVDVIEGDTKSKLIADLEKVTDYTISELVGMDADRLQQIRDDHGRYKARKFVSGSDTGEAEGDVYEALSQKTMYGKYRGDRR